MTLAKRLPLLEDVKVLEALAKYLTDKQVGDKVKIGEVTAKLTFIGKGAGLAGRTGSRVEAVLTDSSGLIVYTTQRHEAPAGTYWQIMFDDDGEAKSKVGKKFVPPAEGEKFEGDNGKKYKALKYFTKMNGEAKERYMYAEGDGGKNLYLLMMDDGIPAHVGGTVYRYPEKVTSRQGNKLKKEAGELGKWGEKLLSKVTNSLPVEKLFIVHYSSGSEWSGLDLVGADNKVDAKEFSKKSEGVKDAGQYDGFKMGKVQTVKEYCKDMEEGVDEFLDRHDTNLPSKIGDVYQVDWGN
jgi:hypothetical protein